MKKAEMSTLMTDRNEGKWDAYKQKYYKYKQKYLMLKINSELSFSDILKLPIL